MRKIVSRLWQFGIDVLFEYPVSHKRGAVRLASGKSPSVEIEVDFVVFM